MEQEQEEQQVLPLTTTPTEQQPETELAPTRTVGTFWERLDEVFKMNMESSKMRNKVEELIEQFSETQRINLTPFNSFLFQPERLALSSSDDIGYINTQPGSLGIDISGVQPKTGLYDEQFFSKFRIRLKKGLVNVKSIQLISCVIPNIVPSFPNYTTGFFYYRLRSLELCQLPNYNPTTPYLQNDVVFYPPTGLGYRAINNVLNETPVINPTAWAKIPDYDNTATYQAPNVVFNVADSLFYRCTSGAPITGQAPPGANWLKLGGYDNTLLYNKGDIVLSAVDGYYYVCIGFNIGAQEPSTSTNFTRLSNDDIAPNYFDLTPDFINVVFLNPTTGYTIDNFGVPEQQTINRRFNDYTDLLTSINECCNNPANCIGAAPSGTIYFTTFNANDQSPVYFQLNNTQPALTRLYYFIPCGYADPNIQTFVNNILTYPTVYTNANNSFTAPVFASNFSAQYTLNSRLGFTWNGVFTSPYIINPYTNYVQSCGGQTFFLMRPSWLNPALDLIPLQDTVTANTSADLVNTSCVRVYADFVFGSTQDSEGNGGLLSIVPVNANNLGVGFYQNNFNNPLTKTPKLITEIAISLTDDQGQPYYLPNSATVLLELGVSYN